MVLPFLVPSKRVFSERQSCERVIVPYESDRFSVSYLADDLNTRPCFGDTEAVSGEYLFIGLCVQFGKALAELEFQSVDGERPVGAFFPLYCIFRQALGVDREEVSYACLFEFEIPCNAVEGHDVHDIALYGTENPLEHVVEVHSDIRSDTSGLMYVAFPRRIVPFSPRGDISEVNVVDFIFGSVDYFLSKCLYFVVQSEL